MIYLNWRRWAAWAIIVFFFAVGAAFLIVSVYLAPEIIAIIAVSFAAIVGLHWAFDNKDY